MLTTFTSPVTKILHLLKIKLFAEQKYAQQRWKKSKAKFSLQKKQRWIKIASLS